MFWGNRGLYPYPVSEHIKPIFALDFPAQVHLWLYLSRSRAYALHWLLLFLPCSLLSLLVWLKLNSPWPLLLSRSCSAPCSLHQLGTVLESPYYELLSAAAHSTASRLYGPHEVHFEGFGVTNMQVTTQVKGSLHLSDGLAILLWLHISSMGK